MGPWSHGGWAREKGKQFVNHIYFGDSISTWYQKNVEREFFNAVLKEKRTPDLPEAQIYNTGQKAWQNFSQWPPKEAEPVRLTFGPGNQLTIDGRPDGNQEFSYLSDPMKPVPFRSEIAGMTFTPRLYMTDDQRHASRRPDVLTFSTEALEEPVTLCGEITARLEVMMTGSDADFVVKIIDVFPEDHENYDENPENIQMGGYQMLVRAEVMRGRFRESFSKPEPFEPDQKTSVHFRLQDILHTFEKGHKIMVQIHSTWFPYMDRNPQKYVENISRAKPEDYQKSTITVFGDSEITVGLLR